MNVLWLGIAFEKAIKLWVYDHVMQRLKKDPYDNSVLKEATAGAVAGVATVCYNPKPNLNRVLILVFEPNLSVANIELI